MRVLRVEEDIWVVVEWSESVELEYMLGKEPDMKDNPGIGETQVPTI